jgi:rhodanese-related sulfurtransferase
VSYDEMKQQHDEMMTRIRAEINGNDPREAVIADLRAQLATANEARQQLQDALHVRDTQLAAVTARAEAAERHNGQVLYLLCNYGHFTATAHRTWLLDQIARELLGTGYDSWMECLEADGLSWGTGEPPK